ncbi:unnamed protein product [Protopolystoma xenopodis]|uniref:Uncharacterized protein n=1 Tax=Protopolystoma xenopodis TaxID=117903 RepID=A0A448X032_9PLAT|nr:unnamed protein product [Protopolystoma xenopodis]
MYLSAELPSDPATIRAVPVQPGSDAQIGATSEPATPADDHEAECLVNVNTEHRVTYLMMSCLVAIFINLPFGGMALVCSIRSHQLLGLSGRLPQRSAGAGLLFASAFIPKRNYRASLWYGRTALILNLLGIVTTSGLLIATFVYLGLYPDVYYSMVSQIRQ